MNAWLAQHDGCWFSLQRRRGTVRPLLAALAIASAGATLAMAQPTAMDEADDALERYLTQRQLTALQIHHLELRLASATAPEARSEIARRLADAYAAMVENAEDAGEREHWSARSLALIDTAVSEEGDELRLSMAQARFRALEHAVRTWRLGMDDASSTPQGQPAAGIGQVERELIQLTGEMAAVAERAHSRSRSLERQRDRALAGELIFLEDEISQTNRRRSLANYLAGWCAYHTAEIQADRMSTDRLTTNDSATQKATEAERHFAWLLGSEDGQAPGIDRLSDTLLGYEHVARSALGYALAESIRGIHDAARIRAALNWIEAIEASDRVAADITRQLPTARALIFARGQRWADLRSLVEEQQRDGQTVPAGMARLLVMLTLKAANPTPQDKAIIEQIRSTAIAALITSGHLNQVLDLASRFGLAGVGESSNDFIGLYTAGLQQYQTMRDTLESRGHNDTAPTSDRAAANQALDAARSLLAALEAPDADRHAGVRGQANLVLGIALFHASGAPPERIAAVIGQAAPLQRAADAFAVAAGSLQDRTQTAYALWMAVRCLDAQLLRLGTPDAAIQQQRQAYADDFIARFPNDDRAAALRLQYAQKSGAGNETALEELLAVPPTSGLYESARRRAVNIAFELYRQAEAGDRAWQVVRFLELADPIFNADLQRGKLGDAAAATAAITQARRMLEALFNAAALPAGSQRLHAERIIAALRELVEVASLAGKIDRDGALAEALYREAQFALADGDHDRAQAAADALAALGPDAAARSARLLYLHLNQQWNALERRDAVPLAEVLDTGSRFIDAAGRLAEALESVGTTIQNAALVTVLFNRAEVAITLWKASHDTDRLTLAQNILNRLLEAHPRDQVLLRTRADLAAAAGDHALAVEDYRRILPALEPGTEAWFEVRTLLIESLARINPARAREVINQHAALYPTFGPAPWGERLRTLHEELPAAEPPREAAP